MKFGDSLYDQSLYSHDEIKAALIKFLKIAGYKIIENQTIGFVNPDIYALKGKHQLAVMIKETVADALHGCIDLAAIKCFIGDKKDYVLALPPVSESDILQFLIEKTEWYYPLSEQAMHIWLVNPERMEVHPVMGWPYDESLTNYLTNPESSNLIAQYVNQKTSQKMQDDEDF